MFGISRLVWAIFFGMTAMAGSFGTGLYVCSRGHKIDKLERENAEQSALYAGYKEKVEKALWFADSIVKLARSYTQQVAEIRSVTQTIVQKQVEYVTANPMPATCPDVPEYVLGLRSEQIDRIWRAAGRELPLHRSRGNPGSTVSDDEKTGSADRTR